VAALVAAALAGVSALALRPAVIGLALAGAMLGAARAELPAGDPSASSRAAALVGLQAVVDGEVADDPKTNANGFEVLVVPRSIATTAGRRPPAGNLMVVVHGSTGEPAAGDQVRVSGRLQWPRDQPHFNRRAYLAQQGAFLEMRSAKLEVVGQTGGPRAFPAWLRAGYQQGLTQLMPSCSESGPGYPPACNRT
jgi:hypothetical protein